MTGRLKADNVLRVIDSVLAETCVFLFGLGTCVVMVFLLKQLLLCFLFFFSSTDVMLSGPLPSFLSDHLQPEGVRRFTCQVGLQGLSALFSGCVNVGRLKSSRTIVSTETLSLIVSKLSVSII